MPLDLGHDPAGLATGCRLVAEAGVKDSDVVRRPSDGPGQQMCDLLLQDRVGRQADGLGVAFGFQERVDLRLGESGIRAEIAAQVPISIALDDRSQDQPPSEGPLLRRRRVALHVVLPGEDAEILHPAPLQGLHLSLAGFDSGKC